METGDKGGAMMALRLFKTEQGNVNFPAVLSIPASNRIPVLAKNDFKRTMALVSVALTTAFEGMNLKRGMNEVQILDLAEAIVDTSTEDNLAFEDLMLFLQKLTRGEYGVTYESMDIPKFMNFFEKYREERWQELNRVRLEQHNQYKVNGDTGRQTKSDPLSEHFSTMGEKLSELKTRVNTLKEENKNLKIDNF